ncbi:30S ribosomal protein S17 [Candidatus Hecatella orcuttiae]|jgi:small subunit ribosomal protein S17|uniref:30S ribosomal protein S17 n=1 Tax=Candidatus Hecatella orcuttiae TaxID=1935119 RepID=UPI0028682C1D|nr:30S ribosomal protein S17 [Candidatus Hecatella orcuttiae]
MRNIGLPVKAPKQKCDDRNCPFHGTLSVRQRILEGRVVSSKMNKTVVIQRDYSHYVPKYMRFERRRSKIPAHNPPCILAKAGDLVKIAECRSLSKTVSFVVVEKRSEAEG